MNGDTIQEREIGEIIKAVQDEEGAKICKAHLHMAQGLIKSLRVAEMSLRLHKWSLIVAVLALVSIWIKGVDGKEFVALLKLFVSMITV